MSQKLRLISILLALSPLKLYAGDQKNFDSRFDTKAVDIPNTSIKWQSIGNCWSYAALGWAESMVLRLKGQVENYSESYMTYRHFEEQIARGAKELQTGGSFMRAKSLMLRYGILMEKDFIPNEAEQARSERQKRAHMYLTYSLKDGPLKDPASRSPALIRSELDLAFGVKLADTEAKIFWPRDLTLGTDKTLESELNNAQEISLRPGSSPSIAEDSLPLPAGPYSERELALMRRVMKAMNSNYPVVLNWFIDFNALNADGHFSLEPLREKGSGGQGYHSVVVEDYTAQGIDENGNPFEVGEGLVEQALQAKAASSGVLTSVIIKNSWGDRTRLDRPSYEVGSESGFHKLEADYLFGYMREYVKDEPEQFRRAMRGLTSVIVPADL